jgi:hypothetical protein
MKASLIALLKAISVLLGIALFGYFAISWFERPYPSKFVFGTCVMDTQVHRIYRINHHPSRLSIVDDCLEGEILVVGDVIHQQYQKGESVCVGSDEYLKEVPCPKS